MGFFRRDKDASSADHGSPAGHAERVALSGDELGQVIDECARMVIEGLHGAPLARVTLESLQVGLLYLIQRECSDEAVIAGQTAARLGYLSRSVEFVRFEAARGTDDELYETLRERLEAAGTDDQAAYDAMAELAAAMAEQEAVDPTPEQGGPSWTLPGLGADARGALRDQLLAGMRAPPDIAIDELKRTWKYGYFLRALDELTEEDE